MPTSIFSSKRLEKLIKKYIQTPPPSSDKGILGRWNATVFYYERRKNWLLFNPKTHYSLILVNITAADLPTIQKKIWEELYLQLILEGVEISHEEVITLIGEISFHSTDANRRALGHINQILFSIECHLESDQAYGFDQINTLINQEPFSLDGPGKYTNLSCPTEEIQKLIQQPTHMNWQVPNFPFSLN